MPDQPLPQGLSPLESYLASRGLTEGQAIVGGVDLTQGLPENIFRYSGMFKGEKGRDIRHARDTLINQINAAGGEAVVGPDGRIKFNRAPTMEQLVNSGFDVNFFDTAFQRSLEQSGIKQGSRLSPEIFSRTVAGSAPEMKELRAGLAERAIGLLGMAEPGVTGGPSDIVGRAGLTNLQQQIRGAYTSRGMNDSGQAAFFEGSQGIQFLENLRQSRQQEAIGLLGVALPEFNIGANLGLVQQNFNQGLYNRQFEIAMGSSQAATHAAGLAANRAEDRGDIGLILSMIGLAGNAGLSTYNR